MAAGSLLYLVVVLLMIIAIIAAELVRLLMQLQKQIRTGNEHAKYQSERLQAIQNLLVSRDKASS